MQKTSSQNQKSPSHASSFKDGSVSRIVATTDTKIRNMMNQLVALAVLLDCGLSRNTHILSRSVRSDASFAKMSELMLFSFIWSS